MSVATFLPGTYVACCRKCGGFTRWCTHDAPRETIQDFYTRANERCEVVVSIRFGDNPSRSCSCLQEVA